MAALKTYTAYLRDGRDDVRFEPLLCASDVDAMSRARKLLAAHPDCDSVEVFFGSELLFAVAQTPR